MNNGKKNETIYGASSAEWTAAYSPSVQEFAALRFMIFREHGVVRIAFGKNGPPIDESGNRGTSSYSHAVTLTEAAAVNLANTILEVVAAAKK
jgi:hypothetical protein